MTEGGWRSDGGIDTGAKATARHWERVGTRRRLGVAVPLFSLRSERSAGIGDVADLERLVDWCQAIGATVVQLLPLNDMGTGTAPYGAISAFATDPIYIALDRLPAAATDAQHAERAVELGRRLEGAARIDYPRVRREKMAMLEDAFARSRDRIANDGSFSSFVATNADWLDDYALYRTLREVHDWRPWEDWDGAYAGKDALRRFADAHAERLDFHRFHQWVIDGQLTAARAYASERGVLLKGDVPILVGRDSADVWRRRELFRLDTSAGAPPDYYAEDGQNWGFPTYDWDVSWRDDCAWWRRRLAHAERYFDLYRIDHVVGLFRIWTIPHGEETGRNGRFVPEDEGVWGAQGRRILEMMLDASRMLPLAEDLGTIPDVCRDTLADMGICGTKVIRWERRWHGDQRFIPPEDYPPLSMATLSTHDSETFRGWWADYPEERQLFWEDMGRSGPAPTLDPAVHEACLVHAARVRSTFLILAIQDILAPARLLHDDPEDNRVNVPGTVTDRNWTYRLPVTLERLLANPRMNEHLARLLRRS